MNKRILYLRKHLGLSQTEFAIRLHRTATTISSIETGKMIPSERIIQDLCTAFGVREAWLRIGEQPVFEDGHAVEAYDHEKLGVRIRTLRKELHLTAGQFAERVGCSKDQIYSAETGRLHPSQEWIVKVAHTFSVNAEWLKTGVGEMFAEQNSEAQPPEDIILYLERHPDTQKKLLHVLCEDPQLWEKIKS